MEVHEDERALRAQRVDRAPHRVGAVPPVHRQPCVLQRRRHLRRAAGRADAARAAGRRCAPARPQSASVCSGLCMYR